MARPLQSTSLPSEAYVLSLVSHPDCIAAAASSPSDAIHLLDRSNLQHICALKGHTGGITSLRSIRTFAETNSDTLMSSGQDGTVKAWDHRSNQIAIKMNAPGQAGILSFDVSPDGQTVAAGTECKGEDASILYWDARKPGAPMHTHSVTHSEDITVVQFHPSGKTLLSASSDGLLNISDPSQADEDEAVIEIGNWGTSVAQAGWYSDGIWASSDMETFSLWSSQLDKTANFNLKHLKDDLPPNHISWEPDYLISCQPSENGLNLAVGSNLGSFSIISPPSASSRSEWSIQHTYPRHHEGIVRTILWDSQSGSLLTGGEDSRIHLWSPTSASSPSKIVRKREHTVEDDEMEVDDKEGYKKARH